MDQSTNNKPFSKTNNFLTQISIYQCLAFIIGSTFLMASTYCNVARFFGFISCTLSMLALQFLCELYERGPFPGNYHKTSALVNNYMKMSGFSLLFGLWLYTVNMFGHSSLLLLASGSFLGYIVGQISWYFNVCK